MKFLKFKPGDRVSIHPNRIDPQKSNIKPIDVGIFLCYNMYEEDIVRTVRVAFLDDNNWEGKEDDIYLVVKKDKENENETKSWTFNSLSTLDIDYTEIWKELSKKNPLILIEEKGKDNSKYRIAIHKYLRLKGDVCDLPFPIRKDKRLYTIDDIGYFTLCEKSDFSAWVSWAKAVKNAPWPKEYKRKAKIIVTQVDV